MIQNKKAQEEMVGFALIVIIVAVILLVFLGFFLSKPNNQSVKSYEAGSFVQSMLQYSTQCQDYYGYISVNNMISMCDSGILCNNKGGNCTCNFGSLCSGNNCINSCAILNSTLNGMLNKSWIVGQGSPIKGYSLNITSSNGGIFSTEVGNITSNSEGSLQDLASKGGGLINVIFNGYY
jgi:hypothetical protein